MTTPLAGVNFAKDGSGTLILSNPDSNYSGTININSGTLQLVGSGNLLDWHERAAISRPVPRWT